MTMYIVRDKTTKAVIHVNPAPLSQHLDAEEIYFQFDSKTMEIIRTDTSEVPKHFSVVDGQIIEPTLQDLVNQGIVVLKPEEKVEHNQIVPKTPSERIAEGLLKLPPQYKVVGEGENEVIVEKTLSEQVAEGLLTLPPRHSIVGEGKEEQIVAEPMAEALAVEPGDLAPNQKLVNGEIVEKTLREQFDEGLLTLDQAKQAQIEHYSALAIEQRRRILPDYKLQNAGLGIYDKKRVATYRATVQAYRAEFHRLQALVEQAASIEDLETIMVHFPTELVAKSDKD
jgi:hypothetical protein